MKRTTVIIGAAAVLTACAVPVDKGSESEVPVDGKADSFAQPIDHGTLAFSGLNNASLGEGQRFHSWTFTLSDAANVTLETRGEVEIDTVMYLYRRSASGWGSYIARNDDHADSLFSRLGKDLTAGDYRVIVKGFNRDVEGPFSVVGACEGDGCPFGLASDAELAAVAQELDNICPDTFCGGDINYYVDAVTCSGGSCDVRYRAIPHGDDGYPADVLGITDWSVYDTSGDDGTGLYKVWITGVTEREGMHYISLVARLQGYTLREHVVAELIPGKITYSDRLYSHFLDALHSMAPNLLAFDGL
jgi:hypothetical protein